jgi:hypothetical protein
MNPLQRAAVRRKAYYFVAILALFTVSMVWRGTIPVPLSGSARAATAINNRTILNQSLALGLRELEQGEVEVGGESLRLALVGSRGVVVTFLWTSAIDAQKRNDFHKMEDRIRTVTQLQPHFITPWIFQSWNIAYNVSVEMQGSGDMYFYIARGIELLAEGERRNVHTYRDAAGQPYTVGSPDMRYQIAFYYQNKFGVSDQVEVLRCLYQLSCIPKDRRNPDALIDPVTKAVDPKAFEAFCRDYPHLVRRLRGEDRRAATADEQTRRRVQEALKCPRPEDVIQFLRDNQDIPTRYAGLGSELAPPARRFPILPPKFADDEYHNDTPAGETGDDFSAYKAARAWFAYGQVPLPPQPRDRNDKPMPAPAPGPGEYDPFRYRIPRQPMLVIFRQGPPRAQSYQAEMEQKEGWFDDEGWRIDDPNDLESNWWFPDPAAPPTQPRPLDVVVGRERQWSLVEWQKAAEMWDRHGQMHGLVLSPQQIQELRDESRKMSGPASPGQEAYESPPAKAALALFYYEQHRNVTNFPYFYAAAQAEAWVDPQTNRPATVLARKTLWQAEQARKLGNKFGDRGAIALYRSGLEQWKNVLKAHPDFHRPERSDRTDEESYAYELAYLRLLVQDDDQVRSRANKTADTLDAAYRAVAARIALLPPVEFGREAREDLRWQYAEQMSPLAGVITEDDLPKSDPRFGGPWIQPEIKAAVRQAQGVQRRSDMPPPQQPGAVGPADAPPIPPGRGQ